MEPVSDQSDAHQILVNYHHMVDEAERLRRALRECRSWCIAGANAIEPRNVLGQVVAMVDAALEPVAPDEKGSEPCEEWDWPAAPPPGWTPQEERFDRYHGALDERQNDE